jgi:hypothetical protein
MELYYKTFDTLIDSKGNNKKGVTLLLEMATTSKYLSHLRLQKKTLDLYIYYLNVKKDIYLGL